MKFACVLIKYKICNFWLRKPINKESSLTIFFLTNISVVGNSDVNDQWLISNNYIFAEILSKIKFIRTS